MADRIMRKSALFETAKLLAEQEKTKITKKAFDIVFRAIKATLVSGHPVKLGDLGEITPVIKQTGDVNFVFKVNTSFLLSINNFYRNQ